MSDTLGNPKRMTLFFSSSAMTNRQNASSVVLARIAGIQKPRMACVAYIHVAWIPAIHAGMTLFSFS
jgi:hypothetical protein